MKKTSVIAFAIVALLPATDAAQNKFKALIVDGQNNHAVWPKSTIMMKQYLEETGGFQVDVARTRYIWRAEREAAWLPLANAGESELVNNPKTDPNFAPDFSQYDLVVSNFGFNAAEWPESTKQSFDEYMRNGGGLIIVHAASNAWADWEAFNRMCGLGGWGGRNQSTGPYVYINAHGEVVRDDGPGRAGAHGPVNEFLITMRDSEHPISRGLPKVWKHTRDECYSMMRGPAEAMTILGTAADTPELQAAGRNEPMLMTINYGKGRIFHTTLGHDVEGFEGVGFIVTFQRGAQWAVTGRVTQAVPDDFPSETNSTRREFNFAGEPSAN